MPEDEPNHDLAGHELVMTAEAAVCLLRALEQAGIAAWIDGGWGVDALVEEQTRPHTDLDLVIELGAAPRARVLFERKGFMVVYDALPTRFVMCDRAGHRLDLHTVTFDDAGGGIQVQPDGHAFRYPPEGFAGEGTLHGNRVRCLTPAVQVLCHLGYTPDRDDYHDMLLLQARFGVSLSGPYAAVVDPNTPQAQTASEEEGV